MPEPRTAPAKSKVKRRWWIRLLRGFGWTVLALIVFIFVLLPPLVLFGGPPIARFFAAKQHLDVNFSLSGSLFTSLTVKDLTVLPKGDGPTPVKKIKIDRLRFEYSLIRLMSQGVGETLSNYEVHHADLAFVAIPSATKEESKTKKTTAETLRTILGQPAAYSDRVEVEDFNIRVTSADAETALLGMNVLLDPVRPGWFRVARIQIPGLPVWEGIDASTSYVNRNLFQRGLRLGPDIVVDEINFDASQRKQKRGHVSVKATVFGGDVGLLLTGEEKDAPGEHLEKSYATHLQVGIHGVRVHDAAAYFGVKDVPVGKLGKLEIDFTGDPEKPRSWNGLARVVVEQLSSGGLSIPEVTAASDFKNGQATTQAGVRIGNNTVKLDGQVALPVAIDGWLNAAGDIAVQVTAEELPALVAMLNPAPKIEGKVGLQAKVSYRDHQAAVQADLQTQNVVFNNITTTTLGARINATLPVHPAPPDQTPPAKTPPPLKELNATVGLESGSVKVGTFEIDSAKLSLGLDRGIATLRELTVKRGSNSVAARVRAELPDDPSRTDLIAGEGELSIKAPQLAEFGVVVSNQTLAGQIDTEARARFKGPKVDGDLQLTGGVALGNFRTHELAAKLQLHDQAIQLERFTVAFNDVDRLETKGHFDTATTQPYDGSLQLGIRDLAVLDPLLEVFGVKEKLKGSLNISWAGKGAVTPKDHNGDLSILLQSAKYGPTEINEFRLTGGYTAQNAKVELQAIAGPTKLGTQIIWADERVSLKDLDLRQGDQKALTGELSYGLAGVGTPEFDPLGQPVQVSLHADQLDIEKLLTSVGQKVPAAGKITMHLAAQGTPLRPEVELKVEGRGLKSQAAAQFDPAQLDVALNYHPGTLVLDASVRQPLIQPLVVKANVPLDVEKLATDKKLDPALPLDATVKMPATSLAFLPKVVPAVRRIAGTVAIDVQARGTVGKPELSGNTTIAIQEARMTAENVPAIGKFDARLAFANDTLKFERFAGEVGGGTFGLEGNIGLAQTSDPTFNLQLKAKEVLGMRNDSITVRADADIKVGGSLKAGTVGGTVFITQSRFYKEIDILPIGLPGRPKPAPKSAPTETNISLPPPLDTWKFDLAIKTREDDPFLVRGNLANGRVLVNLLLGGTGAEPWLEGEVIVEQFTGSLPFSTITVENGHVYFTKNAPFQPTLELQAVSKIRDYTVGAYIYGNAREPQLQLTSEPPLPHADIVSLLATGTTTSELAGNADVLASRAAMLAIQSLWKKIFKPKSAPPPEAKKKDDANFLDRFEMEFGAVDQKSGAREATARFKVNNQTYILGELDTQGRYTGSVKYLLRFR